MKLNVELIYYQQDVCKTINFENVTSKDVKYNDVSIKIILSLKIQLFCVLSITGVIKNTISVTDNFPI